MMKKFEHEQQMNNNKQLYIYEQVSLFTDDEKRSYIRDMQVSIHELSLSFIKHHVNPVIKTNECPIYAVIIMFKSILDLTAYGDHAEDEKNILLSCLHMYCTLLKRKIESKQYWIELIDPCSGLPYYANDNTNTIYHEVAGCSTLLGYGVEQAGFCQVLHHPKWGVCVYPATLFSNTDVNILKDIITEVNEEFRVLVDDEEEN